MRRAHDLSDSLIADDETLFREALRLLLETGRFPGRRNASDGVEAVALTRKLKPDVLLLDLAMPRLPGLEALRSIAERVAAGPDDLVTGAMTRSDVADGAAARRARDRHEGRGAEVLFESIRRGHEGQVLDSAGSGVESPQRGP